MTAPASGAIPHARGRYRVLAGICAAAVMIPVVFTGPAIATPAIGAEFGGSLAALSWIVNAYNVAFGSCVMAGGALADQVGRKRCFVAGLILFVLTSLLIGLAPNLLVLNFMRALEGLGGALTLTAASSLIAQEFEGHAQTRAYSLLGTSFGIGLAFGPMVVGFMIDHLGWRSLFFAIAALSALILLLGCRPIAESRDPDARGIDWPGTLTFTGALVALTFAIAQAPQTGWVSVPVLVLFAGCIVLFGAFVLIERTVARPMLDLSLFRYPRFIGVQLLPIATGFSFVALLVYLPIWFIGVQGYTEFQAGLAILPLTAPMVAVPLLAGALAKRVSPGILCGCGLLIAAIGEASLTVIAPGGSVSDVALPMLAIGIGSGLPWGLMDALSMSVVPKERAGMAAGIFTTMRVAGEAIAITIIGTALVTLTGAALSSAPSSNTSLSNAWPAEKLASTTASGQLRDALHSLPGPLQETLYTLAANAYAEAFRSVLLFLALLAVISAGVCFTTLRSPAPSRLIARDMPSAKSD
jgi:MFS family permease